MMLTNTPQLSSIFANQKLSSIVPKQPVKAAELSLFVVSLVHFLITGSIQSLPGAQNDFQFISFVNQVLTLTDVSISSVILSLKYIQMLGTKISLLGSRGSEYRIWLTALMLADIFLNDNAFTTKSWAEASGIPATDIAIQKREFLFGLNFKLKIQDDEYCLWLSILESFLNQIAIMNNQYNQFSQSRFQQQNRSVSRMISHAGVHVRI